VSDTPQVKHIKEGHFYFSYDEQTKELFKPIVEGACVFGSACDYTFPEMFLHSDNYSVPYPQQTNNRTPCAMSLIKKELKGRGEFHFVSMIGVAHSVEQVNEIIQTTMRDGYLQQKARRNKEIIEEIKQYALTNSSSQEFNLYAESTFLDNILRGGLPVTLKTEDGHMAFNVYSRKHGDLERDYNYFMVAPTFYSQGNGNYRDVNQNRRNDVWFNGHVKDHHVVNFLNLLQADGYNPLVVKGTSFVAEDDKRLMDILHKAVDDEHLDEIKTYVTKPFLPGHLLLYIEKEEIKLHVDSKELLSRLIEICHVQELADHGEGFWSDHWTYNLDLIESFLAIYPEKLKELLLDNKGFSFYHNSHYVVPREKRFILTKNGVRQYHSVHDGSEEIQAEAKGSKLKTKNGEGSVYKTNLFTKLLCLIANKVSSLDPSGVGVEMEADKPNWYDALNGLPGLVGSSLSETLELQRLSKFVLGSLRQTSLQEKSFEAYEELAMFIEGLTNILSLENDPLSYWNKSNDIKEHYRYSIRKGIKGDNK
ncbi:MAG: cellobiose phosphorylase, partial [Candidatus Omnitrophica bacterium]|nr:cellobiose phosphorylase [Candidatus Omnitrophota bacterium]